MKSGCGVDGCGFAMCRRGGEKEEGALERWCSMRKKGSDGRSVVDLCKRGEA